MYVSLVLEIVIVMIHLLLNDFRASSSDLAYIFECIDCGFLDSFYLYLPSNPVELTKIISKLVQGKFIDENSVKLVNLQMLRSVARTMYQIRCAFV